MGLIIFYNLYILNYSKVHYDTVSCRKEEMFVKKKTGITIVGVFVALLLIAVALCVALVRKYTPSDESVAPKDVMSVPEGEALVVFWQEEYEKNALLLNGGIYLDLDTVLSYINEDFYYDEEQ